jgi:hypothetical protein
MMRSQPPQVSEFMALQVSNSNVQLADLKHCPRCEEDLPLMKFSVCRARKDGLNLYCRNCTQEKVADFRRHLAEYRRARGEAPKKPRVKVLSRYQLRQMPPPQRILTVLKVSGALEFADLRRATRLSGQQLSDALPHVLGFGLPVASKNGTGPRRYFLKPKTELEKQVETRRAEEARERREAEMLALAQAGNEFVRLTSPSGRGQGEGIRRTATEETHPFSFSSISFLHPKIKGVSK